MAKVSKKAIKQVKDSSLPSKTENSKVISIRIDAELADAVENYGITISRAFKMFCEDLIKNKTCPTCGQSIEMKKNK